MYAEKLEPRLKNNETLNFPGLKPAAIVNDCSTHLNAVAGPFHKTTRKQCVSSSDSQFECCTCLKAKRGCTKE